MTLPETLIWLVPLLLLFLLFFAGVWLGVCSLLARLSGWPRLAAHFRAAARPAGEPIKAQVVGVGRVREIKVTHMIVSAAGLYLYVNPLFRVLRPPLLLPWARVRYLREREFRRLPAYEFDLAGLTSLTVMRRGYEAISAFAPGAQAGAPPAHPTADH